MPSGCISRESTPSWKSLPSISKRGQSSRLEFASLICYFQQERIFFPSQKVPLLQGSICPLLRAANFAKGCKYFLQGVSIHLGTVVQSVVSLTSSLVVKMLTLNF